MKPEVYFLSISIVSLFTFSNEKNLCIPDQVFSIPIIQYLPPFFKKKINKKSSKKIKNKLHKKSKREKQKGIWKEIYNAY